LACLATLTIFLLTITGAVEHYFDPNKKPVAAVKFLKDEHIPGNMFNNDEFGDYLIYAAYPQYRVFMDGRSDMYGVDHVRQYIKVRGLGLDGKKCLKNMTSTGSFLMRIHCYPDICWSGRTGI
jgi:hypothetical protein